MHASQKRSARTRLLSAVAALLLVATALPSVAAANWTPWFDDVLEVGLSGRRGDLTRTLLTSSGVQSMCGNCQIWAGAHYSGGLSLYANWATGTSYACHNYGTSNIGAMIEAPYTRQEILSAIAGWQGNEGSFYC